MRLRITTAPAPSTPCTCNTDFAISRPIVLTSPMGGSPQCGLLRQNHPMALLMPQSGRRPQHQKQTCASQKAMSALPRIATAKANSRKSHVRFTPESGHVRCKGECPLWAKSDSCTAAKGWLFDHLVGAREQRRRHREAELLCRFEIDHQFVFRWRLNRKIGRLLAFEDAIDVNRGTPVLVKKINAIGDQNATGNINSVGSDRWKLMLGRKRIDQFAMSNRQCARGRDQTAIWLARERSYGAFGLGRVAHIYWSHVYPE